MRDKFKFFLPIENIKQKTVTTPMCINLTLPVPNAVSNPLILQKKKYTVLQNNETGICNNFTDQAIVMI